MKKILYSLLICLSTSLAFTSCTEEEVKPNTELNGGGGTAVDKGN